MMSSSGFFVIFKKKSYKLSGKIIVHPANWGSLQKWSLNQHVKVQQYQRVLKIINDKK